MKSRRVTIVVHVDGDTNSRKYHLPLWSFEAGKWGAVTVALLVVLFFAFAEPLTHAAARVPGLENEVARLRQENARVQQLAAALSRAEANYQGLRQLLGGRAGSAPVAGSAAGPSPDSVATKKPEPDMMRAVALQARAPAPSRSPAASRYGAGPSEPTHWPLDVAGFVTRGDARPGDSVEAHPGIDIAVPTGSPVRAAGGGLVEKAGTDSAYGLFVLLQHPGRYESMYGHASRLLVREGDSVQAGQVIALAGSSGRSTAPHLHFEIRLEGKSLDPLTIVKREN
jgi:murein DD-endopeptidase MepM/ murein hydrolase activator NlpD